MDGEALTKIRHDAERFVTEKGGSWDDTMFKHFRDSVRNRYGYVDENQLGLILEDMKRQYLPPLPHDLEAIKLLGDWSKWLVAVETGSITVIGAFWKFDELSKLHWWSKFFMSGTVILFCISITAAAVILLSIPATVQRLPPPAGKDIFHMGTFEGTKPPRLYVPVNAQAWCFVIGFISFVLAVMCSLWCRSEPTPANMFLL